MTRVLRYFHQDPTKTTSLSSTSTTTTIVNLDSKQDKIKGKSLSTNDFTDIYKQKLKDIEDKAEVNVQADWNTIDTEDDSYIKNKPSSLPASDVYDWAKQETKPSYNLDEVLDGSLRKLSDYIPVSLKGIYGGVATLGANDGKVPESQLPSYVDDVLEFSSSSQFPQTGESGKIYVDIQTNLTYRWTGTQYTEISPSIALGETSSTAYAGDKGKALKDAYEAHASDTTIHITAAERAVWNAKQDAISDLLTIRSNASTAYGWGDHSLAGYLTSVDIADMATKTWVGLQGYTTNTGTVTSVAMTVPTGLSVSGSPITTNGTLAITFASGYSIPTTTKLSNWDTAYGWGDHSLAGYQMAISDLATIRSRADEGHTAYGWGDHSQQGYVKSSGVTSVAMTVPTGLSISGSPITSTGTLALSFANGYSIPTDAKQSNWDTAYSWGNHANAGYAPSNHNHDGRYIRWNGSSADVSEMGWGTLTTSNGYTILSHASSSDGGDWGMVSKNGLIFMLLDGYFYQNEGAYRVLDTSDAASFAAVNHSHSYLPLSGGTLTGNLYIGNSTFYANGTNGGVNSLALADDAILGDCNIGGHLGLKSLNSGDAGISFYASDGTALGRFTANSSGVPLWSSYTIWHSGNDGSGSGLDADLLDGYHEYSFLRYRGNTYTAGDTTLWDLIGIKQYDGVYPEGISSGYTYGAVISIPSLWCRFDLWVNHTSSDGGGGIQYRSGWDSDKRRWLTILDSANWTSFCAPASHSHYRIESLGDVAPETGRTAERGGVYAYRPYINRGEDAPSEYGAVVGFGNGTAGTGEIWVDWLGQGTWYRYLRDCCQDWSNWIRFIDSNNIGSLSVAYATSAGNADTVDNLHATDFVMAYGTTNNNIDSDWGQSIKTFDPIPSGTPPEQCANISLLSLGNDFARRKLLAFMYDNDNIYYRRNNGLTFSPWVKLLHTGNYADYALPLTGGTLTSSVNNVIVLNSTNSYETGILILRNGTPKGWIGYADNVGTYIYNAARGGYLAYRDDGILSFEGLLVLHTGNIASNISRFVDYTLLTPYYYDGNVGTKYYWYRIPKPPPEQIRWYDIYIQGDVNYPRFGHWNLLVGNFNKSTTFNYVLMNLCRADDTEIYISSDYNYVYIQALAAWNCGLYIKSLNGTSALDIDTNPVAYANFGTAAGFTPASGYIFRNKAAIRTDSSGVIDINYTYIESDNFLGNASSATQLQTTRYIWGQPFNGTADISGEIFNASSIEFTGLGSSAGHGGYIDFHYNGSSADYTSRIIEDLQGRISVNNSKFYSSAITTSKVLAGMFGPTVVGSPNDAWSDGTWSHPWYSYDVSHNLTSTQTSDIYSHLDEASYHTTISDYFGIVLRSYAGLIRLRFNGTFFIENAQYTNKIEFYNTDVESVLAFIDRSGGTHYGFRYGNGATTSGDYLNVGDQDRNTYLRGRDVYIYPDTAGIVGFFSGNEGYNGVGTSSPSYKLQVDGACAASSFPNTSDLRLKSVYADWYPTIELIAEAPIFTFKWKDNTFDNDTHIGSSALYWQDVAPELVTTAKDDIGTLSLQYDVLGLASSVTVAKEVIKLQRELEDTKEELELLRAQIAELKLLLK